MAPFIVEGPVRDHTMSLVPNRLEINDFIKIEYQYSLYIQALNEMYGIPQDKALSHFQIGSIHGVLNTPWGGDKEGADIKKPRGGYCTHSSVLFPTWHRSYALLHEQVLQKHAIDIAEKYVVDKERWKKAAIDLRQPYWDWAKNLVPPPEVISMKKVTIIGRDGQRTSVENPLYQYKFDPIEPTFPKPWINFKTTLRRPNNSSPDAKSDVDKLIDELSDIMLGIRDKTFKTLTCKTTWFQFSNNGVDYGRRKGEKAYKDEPNRTNSLEALHDAIHVLIGQGMGAVSGHMAHPISAGFDPIFYMHHAQVDRLLSLWSAMNPDVWVTEDTNETISPPTTVDKHTALAPFRNTASTYWASTGVKDTAVLGYTYPEFNGLDMGNADSVRVAITKAVTDLYGSPASNLHHVQLAMQTTAQSAMWGAAPTPSTLSNAMSLATFAEPEVAVNSVPNIVWEWTLWIRVKKFEVDSSFAVLVFLGNIPESPENWRRSPTYAGAHYAFVNSTPELCANCRENTDIVIEGFVHLDQTIVRNSQLGSFEPDVVEPYLKRELNWRALKADGTVIDLGDLPSLEITTIATPFSMLPGETLPVPGKSRYFHSITYGRPGGSRTLASEVLST